MRRLFAYTALIGMLGLSPFIASAQPVNIGWNFTDLNATYDTGTPANFSVGDMAIANSLGTVSTPINGSSASSGYTGATGGGNIGNAVKIGAFDSASSAYFTVTFTPSAGYSLQITKFDFGARSTSTGPQAYALYSSVDNYAAPIVSGTIANAGTWSLKSNPTFTLNGSLNTAVTLRLYTYGGSGNPGSGTINSRLDDITIAVEASAGSAPTEVRAETVGDGSGTIVAAQTISVGSPLTAYSITRDASHNFVSNASATWSLINKTGGVVDGDLVPAGDGKSAVLTPHAAGSAVIHTVISVITSVDSGVITATIATTDPVIQAAANATTVTNGQTVQFSVTVTPGSNPTSTGISVTGDLSAIGGSASQAFVLQSGNVYTNSVTIASIIAGGTKNLSFTVQDAQSRSAVANLALKLRGNLVIFHDNDTHARVTPHYWVVPKHAATNSPFELVGGAAYVGGKMLQLVTNEPLALVLNGGDISEGNPIGDWNGPGNTIGSFGNGTVVEYFKMLDAKLRAIPGRGGRGLDAMVVGNHDIRDISYITNMQNQTAFPVISINICSNGTHNAYFKPYVILNVNGNKVGVIGYTTESADSPEAEVNNLIDVVQCDWSSADSSKIHFADYVNELRNVQGCDMVILLTHMGHSGLCTITGANPTPILVDDSAAKLPEIVVSGHWHTFCDTAWEPTTLNYKTIFTEAGSFTHYISELRVTGLGNYITNANYPLRNSEITPDPDIANFIQARKDEYAAVNTSYGVDQVVGYTSDDLLLDNYMKWWSADEYPWSGNNTAGNWICDAVQWKAQALFGQCDLSMESGGGVRSDIPAGPITYSQIYETFPWPDDLIYVVNMTGQEIWNYFKGHGCDVAFSQGWHVTAFDGVPTSITLNNGTPINLSQTYKVAINNYMYLHDPVPFSDPSPQASTALARTALFEYTAQFTSTSPYDSGPSRYMLNNEFSGGYRAVVTMVNDADARTTFDNAYIRFLSATPETLQHRGTAQVPTSFVNTDGSFVVSNRLGEIQLYRSYLGVRTNVLKPGDIIETWGKGSFFEGNPEFVDQEGVQSDGVEFKIVGHDDSLAKPTWVPSITVALDDNHKNHYVKLLVKQTGASAVVDGDGITLTVKDVTGYSNKTLPGSTGSFLYITGVPTSENFAMRFRCDNAVVASGVSSFPTTGSVVSSVEALPANSTAAPLEMTATASIDPGNVYLLSPTADATVSSGNPTTVNNSTTLFIASGSSGFANERPWLKFDLSAIPGGATITNAQFQLYCWSAATAATPASAHGGSSDSWAEASLTWNTQPAFGGALDTVTLAASVANLYYSWDVTAFVQTEFAGDKVASLVVKPVTENTATAYSYKCDSKEFGSTPPVLKVITQPASLPTITQVQFFYRYSTDNAAWGSWTLATTDTTAPYSASFNYPNGFGYYEFYSIASDSNGGVESAPLSAQAFTHYTASPVYPTEAIVMLDNLVQTYNGTARSATVTTVPHGLSYSVTYNGSASAPVHTGVYSVVATVTASSYTGTGSDNLTILPADQTITFGSLPGKTVGDAPFVLTATASSGLPVSYTSGDSGVATVSGNTVTIVGSGSTVITAYQTGNSDYNAASPFGQTLTVSSGGGGGGNGDGTDVPLLPPWGIGTLASLLAGAGVLASRRGRASRRQG